ncbi:MAG: BtpA/SgcQ family protein [Planctomycetota bacterium]
MQTRSLRHRRPRAAALFGRQPALVATIHLPPLPGSPARRRPFDPEAFLAHVRREAESLRDAGFDAVLIENFGDAPFFRVGVEPHTVALLAMAAREARLATGLPTGINALRNDARAALGAAAACGASFIRVNVHVGMAVTDQGLIEGDAAATLRYRAALGTTTLILADVHVKHAYPLGPSDVAQATAECLERGRADAVIITGPATGQPPAQEDLDRARAAARGRPVLAGSGVRPDNLAELLAHADGIIVSSSLRRSGRAGQPLDGSRLEAFSGAARRCRRVT